MYVKHYMTANPYTLSPEDTVTRAMALLKEKKIRRLPILSGGKLVGIVTERQLLEVSPSKATTLSIYEINHLLSQTKLGAIMSRNVITVTPDTLLEEAAMTMRSHTIGALPVMEGDRLVGIITETDIFDAFLEIMGLRDEGARIVVAIGEDRPGTLARLSTLIAGFGINILHLAVARNEILLRLNTPNVDDLVIAIQEAGFRIIQVRSMQAN